MTENLIIGLKVADLSYKDSIDFIISKAKERSKGYCCFANVHMTIEAYDDANFAQKVNQADLVCADGMPLVKAIKLLYGKPIERVAGMDMMPSLMEVAEKEGLSVFFFGTSDEMLSKISAEVQLRYTKLKVAGMLSPPFRRLTEEEKQEHITLINQSNANLVFVALGCPKQEKWMAENYKQINAILLGVGGAFPVFAKAQSRAPEWLRKFSLEWMYRLMQDPKRLFKRYFYTNSKFLFLLTKQLVAQKTNQ